MNDSKSVIRDADERMKKSFDLVQQGFASVRTGRANAGMVEHLRVDYYGASTPLKQLSNVTVPEPRMILIQPWDASALKAVEKTEVKQEDLDNFRHSAKLNGE